MGVSHVRVQEVKDVVVKLSVIVVIDFGDGAGPTSYMFQQMALRVLAELEERFCATEHTMEL